MEDDRARDNSGEKVRPDMGASKKTASVQVDSDSVHPAEDQTRSVLHYGRTDEGEDLGTSASEASHSDVGSEQSSQEPEALAPPFDDTPPDFSSNAGEFSLLPPEGAAEPAGRSGEPEASARPGVSTHSPTPGDAGATGSVAQPGAVAFGNHAAAQAQSAGVTGASARGSDPSFASAEQAEPATNAPPERDIDGASKQQEPDAGIDTPRSRADETVTSTQPPHDEVDGPPDTEADATPPHPSPPSGRNTTESGGGDQPASGPPPENRSERDDVDAGSEPDRPGPAPEPEQPPAQGDEPPAPTGSSETGAGSDNNTTNDEQSGSGPNEEGDEDTATSTQPAPDSGGEDADDQPPPEPEYEAETAPPADPGDTDDTGTQTPQNDTDHAADDEPNPPVHTADEPENSGQPSASDAHPEDDEPAAPDTQPPSAEEDESTSEPASGPGPAASDPAPESDAPEPPTSADEPDTGQTPDTEQDDDAPTDDDGGTTESDDSDVQGTDPGAANEPAPAEVSSQQLDMQSGFRARYYDVDHKVNKFDKVDWETDPTKEEVIGEIDYADGHDAFWEGGPDNTFAVRITGEITVDETGSFDFFLSGADGMILYIDGVEVVEDSGLHGYRTRSGEIELEAGTHEIEVRYYEHQGHTGLKLEWEGPGTDGRELVQADPDLSVEENGALNIRLTGDEIDADSVVSISGLPADTILISGDKSAVSDGSEIDLTGWDLDMIELMPPNGFEGTISADVVVYDTTSDGEEVQLTKTFEIDVGDVEAQAQNDNTDEELMMAEDGEQDQGDAGWADDNAADGDDTDSETGDEVMEEPVSEPNDADQSQEMTESYERSDW